METDKGNAKLLWTISEEAKEHHQQIKGFLCHKNDAPEFGDWSRQWRKKFEPIYYRTCSVKVKDSGELEDATTDKIDSQLFGIKELVNELYQSDAGLNDSGTDLEKSHPELTKELLADLYVNQRLTPEEDNQAQLFEENCADLSDVDSIENLVAQLFDSDFDWLAKRLDKCNLTDRDKIQVFSWRPLRNFLSWATSRKEPVQICNSGFDGAFQISVIGVKADRASDITMHAKSVPGLKRIYSQDNNSVFEIVVPEETENKPMEWKPQELHRNKEPLEQAAMFDSGPEIAKALGIKYDGIQTGDGDIPDMMQFTDLETGSTTYGNTLKEVKSNLERMRGNFKAKTSDMLRSDPVNGEVSSVDIPLTCGSRPVETHIRKAIESAEEA